MRELINPDESKQICSPHLKKGSFCFKQLKQESRIDDQQKEAHKIGCVPFSLGLAIMEYTNGTVLSPRAPGYF